MDRAQGNGRRRPAGLTAIALFKFFKATLLAFTAVAALNIARGSWLERLAGWTPKLGLYPLQFPPEKLIGATVASGVYGALFFVEGSGLWMTKHWAEYLTIVTTAGFIPLEVIELTKRPGPVKWVTLAINVAIIAYLVLRVNARRRSGEHAHARPLATNRVVTSGARH